MKALRKVAKQLPSRGGLNSLVSSPKTINDYSKSTPLQLGNSGANLVQNLRKVDGRT